MLDVTCVLVITSVSGTHQTVRLGAFTADLSPFLKHIALHSTLHIDIQTLAKTPFQDHPLLPEGRQEFYRVRGAFAAAPVGFWRQRGTRRDGFASEGARE